jgi:hypothetical protein
MNLDEKLKKKMYKDIWEQYCGFLDLNMSEYMEIQKRLMREQLQIYATARLGAISWAKTRPKR